MNYRTIYIDGEWIKPNSKDIIEVENPANKTIIGSVPSSNDKDVDMAVKAAKKAFKTFQFSTLEERKRLLEKLALELDKRVDIMSSTISKELGCGISFAKNMHVLPYIKDIRDFINIAEDYPFEEVFDEYIVRREAVGVIAALTPWNYPLGQIIKKISPAILSGSTLIIKPSQKTPLVAFILAEAINDSNFPKGVINIISGKGAVVGNVLAKHKDVDMVTLTGSTKGGLEISRIAVEGFKRFSLELGGKSPSIILKGADKKLAIKKTLDKMYLNTGQSCSAYSRLFVHIDEKEEIEQMVIDMTKEYIFGDPSDKSIIIGPLANKRQFDKVKYYIKSGINEGARLLIGEIPEESNGYYVNPCVFTDVKNNMEIAQNEIFGPVLCIISYNDIDEAIDMANDTIFGLSGGVFGPEEDALYVAKRLRTGTIVINNGNQLHRAPFGGFKASGIGREGGKYAIDEFTEIKTLFTGEKKINI